MKRRLIVFLFVLVQLLSACSFDKVMNEDDKALNEDDKALSEEFSPGYFMNDYYLEIISGDCSLREYFSYEGYKAYPWAKAKNDVSFVGYELFEALGEFASCRMDLYNHERHQRGYTNTYAYTLIDPAGFEYTIAAFLHTRHPDHSVSSVEKNDNDMRKIDSNDKENCVAIGDIRYHYECGELNRIHWKTKSYELVIAFTYEGPDKIDINDDTFISKMINSDTAEQAVAELNEKIERNLVWNRFVAKATVPLIIVGILLLALLSFLVIRKNILRRNAKEKAKLLECDNQQNAPPADSNELAPKDAVTDNIS